MEATAKRMVEICHLLEEIAAIQQRMGNLNLQLETVGKSGHAIQCELRPTNKQRHTQLVREWAEISQTLDSKLKAAQYFNNSGELYIRYVSIQTVEVVRANRWVATYPFDSAWMNELSISSIISAEEYQEALATVPPPGQPTMPRRRMGIGSAAAAAAWLSAETELYAEGLLPVLGVAKHYNDWSTPSCVKKAWFRGGVEVAVETFGQPGIYGTPESNPGQWRIVMATLDGRANLGRTFSEKERIGPSDYLAAVAAALDAERINWSFAWGDASRYHYQDVNESPEGFFREKGSEQLRVAKVPYRPAGTPFTQCRVCGCTNDDCRQCIEATGQPCSWAAPYLCSRCYEQKEGGQKNG